MLRLSPELQLRIAQHLDSRQWLYLSCCCREIRAAIDTEEYWSGRYDSLRQTLLSGEFLIDMRLWYGCRDCTSEYHINTLQPPVHVWDFHRCVNLALQPHATRPCQIRLPLLSSGSCRQFMSHLAKAIRYLNHVVFADEVNGHLNDTRLTLELTAGREARLAPHSRHGSIKGSLLIGTLRVIPFSLSDGLSVGQAIELDMPKQSKNLSYLRENIIRDSPRRWWYGICHTCGRGWDDNCAAFVMDLDE